MRPMRPDGIWPHSRGCSAEKICSIFLSSCSRRSCIYLAGGNSDRARHSRQTGSCCWEETISTFVEYWGVGATTSSSLPMTTSDICGHLLADWVPSLPAAVGSSFIGWPPYLLQVANVSKTDLLAVRAEAARSERQWKSF